MHASAVTE